MVLVLVVVAGCLLFLCRRSSSLHTETYDKFVSQTTMVRMRETIVSGTPQQKQRKKNFVCPVGEVCRNYAPHQSPPPHRGASEWVRVPECVLLRPRRLACHLPGALLCKFALLRCQVLSCLARHCPKFDSVSIIAKARRERLGTTAAGRRGPANAPQRAKRPALASLGASSTILYGVRKRVRSF